MKTHFKISILIIFILSLVSCSNSYYKNTLYKLNDEYYTINADNTFSYNFYGDYSFKAKNKSVDPKIIKKVISTFPFKSKNQFLYTLNTDAPLNISVGLQYKSIDFKPILNFLEKKERELEDYILKNQLYIFYRELPYHFYCDTYYVKNKNVYRITHISSKKNTSNLNFKKNINKLIHHVNSEVIDKYKANLINTYNPLFNTTLLGNYLGTLNFHKKHNQLQFQITFENFINSKEKYKSANKLLKYKNDTFNTSQLIQKNAFQTIIDNINNYDVLLINENHWQNENRIVLNMLLDSLKFKGFNALAMEAYYHNNQSILKGIPTQKSGFYTLDPAYGNLLRKALQLGFKLYEYDFSKNIPKNISKELQYNYRDSMQAINLKKILTQHNKLIVFSGQGHIFKKVSNPKLKTMGMFLQTMIPNKKTLTIDQSLFTNFGDSSNKILKDLDLKEPSILTKNNFIWTSNKDSFDYQIFFPLNQNWFLKNYQCINQKYNSTFLEKLIYIYNEKEPLDNHIIPITLQYIENENTNLCVPNKGTYQYLVVDEYGIIWDRKKIKF